MMFFYKHCVGVFCLVSSAALGLPPTSQMGDVSLSPVGVHLRADLSRGTASDSPSPRHGETLNVCSPCLFTKEGSEHHGKSAGDLSCLHISRVL